MIEALRIAASLATLNHSGVAILAASAQLNPRGKYQIDTMYETDNCNLEFKINNKKHKMNNKNLTMAETCMISPRKSDNKFTCILH